MRRFDWWRKLNPCRRPMIRHPPQTVLPPQWTRGAPRPYDVWTPANPFVAVAAATRRVAQRQARRTTRVYLFIRSAGAWPAEHYANTFGRLSLGLALGRAGVVYH